LACNFIMALFLDIIFQLITDWGNGH